MKISRIIALIILAGVCLTGTAQTPRFELDRDWPQLPLGERWLTGGLGGLCISPDDHVFLLNRQNVVAEDLDAARLAPPIIELNADGEVVRGWGDPELIGDRLHDCYADKESLWLVAAATGYVQKWARDGSELLMQIGEPGAYDSDDGTRRGRPLNSDNPRFFLPAAIDVDSDSGEIYVADGELPGGNSRIAVLSPSGEFLRQWRLVRSEEETGVIELPHCLRLADDGLVYVCDRRADRIQVFNRQGELLQQIPVKFEPQTSPAGRSSGGRGTAVVLDFSNDPEQRYLYVINQNSVAVEILDRRSGAVQGRVGFGPGRYPGQFELPHGIAVDSQGNIYVAEQEGRRVQRFLRID